MIHFPLFEHVAEKTLTTLHGRLDCIDLVDVYRRWRAYPLVSISNHQRTPLPFANWIGTVPHGISLDRGAYRERSDGYLAFLGRISPEKRPDRAIEIALRLRKPLKIAAKIDMVDKAYYHRVIEPMLKGQRLIEYIGEINDAEKVAFLGGADALLFPIDWPEPFGLVMIEAMACGTPVIACGCGSVPEVVEEGTTGFIFHDLEDAVSAVENLHKINRAQVRKCFELRYSASAMARRYLELYAQLAEFDGSRGILADRPEAKIGARGTLPSTFAG
jgi:glycosyltransferase involved in cell wall biosynthesis